MKNTLIFKLLVALVALPCFGGAVEADPPKVHSVSDISQEFTFYMDGRFHRQYLADHGKDVRNWGSLSKLDLSNTNLLILTGGNPRIPYSRRAIRNISKFVREGGTLLLMADGTAPDIPGHALASLYNAKLTDEAATKPLKGVGALADAEITFRRGNTLELNRSGQWTVLIEDKNGKPVLASRSAGRGHVILGSRGLFGQRPDASDPINAEWITPLLVDFASRKTIDPSTPHRATRTERKEELGPLTLEYHDGTAKFAQAIYEVYKEVRPHLEVITGCEPSPGMIKSMLVLPTGGGGFSSGARIAIGAWWGNYPEKRYPMIELIAHEAGHSWVLPHAEPLWNEPIATYLGIQVGRRMGMPEADETLGRQIARARKHDPNLDTLNPLAEDARRDVIWGKSYYVFEELEKNHGPGALAKYFAAKRALITRDRPEYTMDDCVAVWSRAVDEDLFPWFRSLAFDVDASRTELYPVE